MKNKYWHQFLWFFLLAIFLNKNIASLSFINQHFLTSQFHNNNEKEHHETTTTKTNFIAPEANNKQQLNQKMQCKNERWSYTNTYYLSEVIKDTELGIIEVGHIVYPTKRMLLAKILARNPGINLTIHDFEIKSINLKSAQLSGKRNYQNLVSIYYTLLRFDNLDTPKIPITSAILSILRTDNTIFLGTNNGLYSRINEWKNFWWHQEIARNEAILILTNIKNNIYVVTDNGEKISLYRSSSNLIFTKIYISNYAINDLVIDDNEQIYLATNQGIKKITKDGQDIITLMGKNGDNSFVKLIINQNDNTIYALSSTDYLYKTKTGKTLSKLTNITNKIYCININKGGHIYFATADTIYFSSDEGNNFEEIVKIDGVIQALVISNNERDIIYSISKNMYVSIINFNIVNKEKNLLIKINGQNSSLYQDDENRIYLIEKTNVTKDKIYISIKINPEMLSNDDDNEECLIDNLETEHTKAKNEKTKTNLKDEKNNINLEIARKIVIDDSTQKYEINAKDDKPALLANQHSTNCLKFITNGENKKICIRANVDITITEKAALSTIITNTNLTTSIYTGQSNLPSANEVLNAIKIANPKARKLAPDVININQISPTTAVVTSNKYSGEVKINFNSTNFKILTTLTSAFLDKDTTSCFLKVKNGIYLSTIPGKGLFYQANNSDKFIKVSGVDNTTIWDLKIDSKGTVYAAGNNGIVYHGKNGSNFQSLYGCEGNLLTLAIDEKRQIIYAGGRKGLFKSENGSNFIQIRPIKQFFDTLTLSLAKNGNLYVGNYNSLYELSEQGEKIRKLQLDGTIAALATNSKGHIYAGCTSGLFVSQNNGNSFKKIKRTSSLIINLLIDESPTDTTIYIGTEKHGIMTWNSAKKKWTIMSGKDDISYNLGISEQKNIYAGGSYNNKPAIYYSESINQLATKAENNLKVDINAIVTKTYLNNIYIAQRTLPSKSEIIAAINANNKDLNFNDDDIELVTPPTATTAVIKGINYYKGQIQVNYQCDNFQKLAKNGLDLDKNILKIIEINGYLYVLTVDNLYYKAKETKLFQPFFDVNHKTNMLTLTKDVFDNIYVACTNGIIYKFQNNNLVKVYETKYNSILNLAVVNNNIYFTYENQLFKIIDKTMLELWRTTVPIINLEVSANETIYVTNTNGIYEIKIVTDKHDQIKIITTKIMDTKNKFWNIKIDIDNTVYFASNVANIYKLDHSKKKLIKFITNSNINDIESEKLKKGTLQLAISSKNETDKTIFAVGVDGIIYKYSKQKTTMLSIKDENILYLTINKNNNNIYIITQTNESEYKLYKSEL